MEIGDKVIHNTLGEGEVTDIYEERNGNTYFDVHFDSQENKYKVSTFNIKTYDKYFKE